MLSCGEVSKASQRLSPYSTMLGMELADHNCRIRHDKAETRIETNQDGYYRPETKFPVDY